MALKSLSNILMKHLSGLGDNWHLYTRPAMLTYNTYNTPNLDNLSPFELALGRKPILVPRLENTPHIPVTGTFAKAKQVLEQKLKYLREKLQKSFRVPTSFYLYLWMDICIHFLLKKQELNQGSYPLLEVMLVT